MALSPLPSDNRFHRIRDGLPRFGSISEPET
jgi:hypothetical protein